MKSMKRKLFLSFLFILIIATISADDVEIEPNEESISEPNQNLNENIRRKIKLPAPKVPSLSFLELHFDGPEDLTIRLIKSEAKKDGVDSALSKYDGIWSVEEPHSSALEDDFGLVMKSKAKHYAISAPLTKIIDFVNHDTLVIQYEVKFQTALDCGGAYVKLLSQQTPALDLRQFVDKTPYTIMFGPDKCGLEHKLHFIIRHKNPITGAYEEKHAKKPKSDLDRYFSDQKTHLYTLVINAENKFEIYIDQNLVNSGSLLEDLDPPINPSKEIDDPEDKRPADWDEREKIPDPLSKKPDDWDETQPETIVDNDAVKPEGWLDDESPLIPDETSEKPSDWDSEMDGEWEAPKIDNPKCKDSPGCGEWKRPTIKNPLYKGKWSAPLIDNPNYRGVWKARRISNPNYFEDTEPYRRLTPVFALGFELWSMTEEVVFDNLLLVASKEEADAYAAETWAVKRDEERKADPKAQSVVDAIQEVTREKPWIWAIVALVIGLPLLLIIYYCCIRGSGGRPRPVSSTADAMRKKTDLPMPDDDDDDNEEPELEPISATTSNKQKSSSGPKVVKESTKASLESSSEEENEDAEDNVVEEISTHSNVKTSSSKSRSRSRSNSKSRLEAASDKPETQKEDNRNKVVLNGDDMDGNLSGDKKSSVTKRRSRKD